MRLLLRHALLVIATLGLGAALFLAAGLVPIAADAGHWPVTRAVLEFAMSRAVQVRAVPLRAPPLDDPAIVQKGAGHYVSGCMPCHGAPGTPRDEIARHMLPAPPFLPSELGAMSPEELFWVVSHGIKYTAMPSWTAGDRDDEVWAMVAFLERMPELTPAQFRALAYGESEGEGEGKSMPGDCARCHGRDGTGRDTAAYPRLAGLDRAYLLASLEAFASGKRHSGIMQPVAAALDARELRALAAHYAAQPSPGAAPGQGNASAAAIARGERLAARGDGMRRIPACAACHGPGTGTRNPLYPSLSGQHADYLVLQLELFRRGGRGGTPYAHVMEQAAAALQDRDIRDLAIYYASLVGEGGAGM
jgi:cytochrome c553